uniref:Uncharacterized protein n=1 Tax=Hyaloperonospora arabidopsidis (strain Emoy2) TaxID=559515 RepID=M4BDA3_HYAAE
MKLCKPNPSDHAGKNLPGKRGIDDPGWSGIEDRYWVRQGSAASSDDRTEVKLGMFLCLHPRPGYHEGTSIWDGKCKKKGSNRMSRSQWPAIIPCKMNDHLPPGPSSRSTLFPLLPDLIQLGIAGPLFSGKEDYMRGLLQSVSVSILKLQIQGGELVHPVRGKEVGTIRRAAVSQGSWAYKAAI